jgi:hypothetical protein
LGLRAVSFEISKALFLEAEFFAEAVNFSANLFTAIFVAFGAECGFAFALSGA